jgi:Tfp pilus assembly protein PilP
LYDPPPPKPEVKQLPPLSVELLGTILEGDNSIAMVRSEQGQVEYRRKGDFVGPVDSPALVVEIQSDAIVLDRAEERVTLKVLGSEQR